MAETKTWRGGCHCGKVAYEVETDLAMVIACNCSHCQAKGFLLTFVPPSQFRQTAGRSEVTEYQFNKKQIHHLFCATCGVESFARGTGPEGEEVIAINIRCLDGIELDKIEARPFNGRAV